METEYNVILTSATGDYITTLDGFFELTYTVVVNDVGALRIVLPPTFDPALLEPDMRIEVWRRVGDGALRLDADQVWFIRRWDVAYHNDNTRALTISAVSALDLLRRRIIAYPAGSGYTAKSGAADTILHAFVRENLGAGVVAADRDGDDVGANIAAHLDIANAAGVAPTVSKAATRRNLLNVCREIAEASSNLGVYLAFDIIYDGSRLQFQTFPYVRGIDRRSGGAALLFGPAYGNVSDAVVTYDYSDEATVAIVGGAGQEEHRLIVETFDAIRRARSPFARIETFVSDTNATTATQLSAVGAATLRQRRPRTLFRGSLQDTPATRYGRDWGLGDYVRVQAGDLAFDCRIDRVSVRIDARGEQIDATLKGESDDA